MHYRGGKTIYSSYRFGYGNKMMNDINQFGTNTGPFPPHTSWSFRLFSLLWALEVGPCGDIPLVVTPFRPLFTSLVQFCVHQITYSLSLTYPVPISISHIVNTSTDRRKIFTAKGDLFRKIMSWKVLHHRVACIRCSLSRKSCVTKQWSGS